MSTILVGHEKKVLMGQECIIFSQTTLNALLDDPKKLAELNPYDHFGFEGPIKIYNRTLPDRMEFLVGAVIMGSLHLQKVEVAGELDLTNCKITGSLILDEVRCGNFSHGDLIVMGEVIFNKFAVRKGW